MKRCLSYRKPDFKDKFYWYNQGSDHKKRLDIYNCEENQSANHPISENTLLFKAVEYIGEMSLSSIPVFGPIISVGFKIALNGQSGKDEINKRIDQNIKTAFKPIKDYYEKNVVNPIKDKLIQIGLKWFKDIFNN